jgi:hypothetical protein
MAPSFFVKAQLELEGVGYREQELQLAKGSVFASEVPEGVLHASFGGNTNIFIKGNGMTDNAQGNRVMMLSEELGEAVPAPLLTEDDAFSSNTVMGMLSYRLPSPSELLGIPDHVLHQYQSLTFTLYLEVDDSVLGTYPLECATASKCRVKYQRQYTPVLFDLSPPVVYFDSETTLIFDPKGTTGLIQDLPSDEMHFINAKIGGALMDFEASVTFESSYSQYYRNHIKGRVGDQKPSADHSFSMLWETGNAQLQPVESLHCEATGDACYHAKTVPVIHDMTSHSGYITGGQSITVTGYGFDSENIDAKLDGVDCVVRAKSDNGFTCDVQAADTASTVDVPNVGQHGIRKELVDSSLSPNNDWVWFSDFDDLTKPDWTRKESLALQLEAPNGVGDRLGHKFKGWFVAPLATNYKFYMACDDDCIFKMDQAPMSTTNLTELISITAATGFREYWRESDNGNRSSEWIALEAGEHYYIEMWAVEGYGHDHASVAVEIEQTDVVGHHQSMKEMQKIVVSVD